MRTVHYTLISFTILLIVGLAWANRPADAQTAATCQSFFADSMPQQGSIEIEFFCNQTAVTYFGVCDSGNQADDNFEMIYKGTQVSNNYFTREREKVEVLSAVGEDGFNVVTLNSTNASVAPPATYGYAISTSFTQVQSFLFSFCGADYTGIGIICSRVMPIFIKGEAPSSGTLVVMGRFGELNRMEGITFARYTVAQGAVANNLLADVRGPTYIRVWWQPSGSTDWYLLPSQYWRGGGTIESEYGIECDHSMGVPSYDTDWSQLIKDSEVPLLDINDDGKIEIIPTLTVWARQTATAQATSGTAIVTPAATAQPTSAATRQPTTTIPSISTVTPTPSITPTPTATP